MNLLELIAHHGYAVISIVLFGAVAVCRCPCRWCC